MRKVIPDSRFWFVQAQEIMPKGVAFMWQSFWGERALFMP